MRAFATFALLTFRVKLSDLLELMLTSPPPQLQFPQSAAPTAAPAANVNIPAAK